MRVTVIKEKQPGTFNPAAPWVDYYYDQNYALRSATGGIQDAGSKINTNLYEVFSDRMHSISSGNNAGSDRVKSYRVKINRVLEYDKNVANLTPLHGRIYVLFQLIDPVAAALVNFVDIAYTVESHWIDTA